MDLDWDRLLADCVSFAQRLIQTPSMTGEEAEIAELIATEMRKLEFDDVWLDAMGNVIGRIRGQERLKGAIVLNSHIDHVDPGDLALWPVPPYSAAIVEGRILGRGACDIKGPLAVQIYAMAALKRAGVRPRRDIVFTGVVAEETSGAGSKYWVENLDYPVALIVLGEPTDNDISLGHRSAAWLWVKFHGRSVHASVPDNGVNPNYALAEFLKRLDAARSSLSAHQILGKTSVAPTIVEVDTTSPNVTPAWTRVLLDFRTATESLNSLAAFIDEVAGELPHSLSLASVAEPDAPIPDSNAPIFGFYTEPDSAAVARAQQLIGEGTGRRPELIRYEFGTDGRFFTQFPVIGYSPAEEPLAHTVRESISIAKMRDSLAGHFSLLSLY